MAKNDDNVLTALYLHPAVRAWLEARARFEGDTMSGVLRKLLREHIQNVDPDAWTGIEATLRADAAPADGDREGDEAAADGG